MDVQRFDLVVVGAGPAGERAAILAARAGKSVAVVEKEHVPGGTRVNWGTIPSKTLRESALFVHGLTASKLDRIHLAITDEITIGDFMARERAVVKRELELINKALARYAVTMVRGTGRFADPHTIEVVDPGGAVVQRLAGDVIVLATGSAPNHPRDVPFDLETVFDSSTILWLPRMPKSMIVLGAGVIGIEYAAIFAALGLEVTLVDTRDRLLPYLDREIVGILERELATLGVTIVHDDHYRVIEKMPGLPPSVLCLTRADRTLEADVMLYCVGRDGNTADLALEKVGLAANARGLIEVDEFYRTALPHVYAVGDVIGYPALASTSMEQGRQAVRHAFSIPGPMGRTEVLPFAIYSIPEVSYIGETEDALRERGARYFAGRGRYDLNPRGQILGATGGVLKLLFDADSMQLLGVHIVGYAAAELVHIGQAYLNGKATAQQIAETLYNYPTLSDLYRHAALEAVLLRETS